MREELLDKAVLAMYDVRGIQSYIFKSNAAKEIIGASELIADVIRKGLGEYIRKNVKQEKQTAYRTDWEQDDALAFLQDSNVQIQVLFVGGGNAYVLFRKGAICQKVNRFLAKYIMEATYSLNLATAVVEKTDCYADDYKKIQEEMRRIKAYMPMTQPVGAFPFMKADSITGYPITQNRDGKQLCTEAGLKRAAVKEGESEKVFDHMIIEKGDNSTLAICHIDGNSMGQFIMKQMQGVLKYEEAVPKMRAISGKIASDFRDTFDGMCYYMETLSPQVKKDNKYKLYREMIVAGDDITFVCNAKLALPAVDYFLTHIGDRNGYSACAGIAYFNSHFPFSDAYQVAEACCESAKKRGKQNENRGESDQIGNFFDFQICTNIRAVHLADYRQKHYRADMGSLLARPYYVPLQQGNSILNEKNKAYDVRLFENWLAKVNKMPRSKAKALRDAISKGRNEMEETVAFLQSRQIEGLEEFDGQYAICYDALEVMDLYLGEDKLYEDKN